MLGFKGERNMGLIAGIAIGIACLIGQAAFAEERTHLSIGEVCRILTTHRGNFANWGPGEPEITFRLGWLRARDEVFVASQRDAVELLLVMTDDKTDIIGRICAASVLLDLDNDAARAFLDSQIAGKDRVALHNSVL